METKVYFVLGQTATGKTAMATKLANDRGGELINCDSRQIYKNLDIITGKTDNPNDVRVHCVDLADPKERYSAYDYALQAMSEIRKITARNVTPIIVGGTGMYAYILKYIDPGHPPIKTEITNSFDHLSLLELQEKIRQEYSFIWDKLNDSDKKNKRRLSSALQRLLYGGHQPLNFESKNNLANSYKLEEFILLHKDETILEARLIARINNRLQIGALRECKQLLASGYSPNDPGLATLGYHTIFKYLQGQITEKSMLDEWYRKERQYAKRQKTYLLKYFPKAEIVYV